MLNQKKYCSGSDGKKESLQITQLKPLTDANGPVRKQLRVLIIDDDIAIIRMIATICNHGSHIVPQPPTEPVYTLERALGLIAGKITPEQVAGTREPEPPFDFIFQDIKFDSKEETAYLKALDMAKQRNPDCVVVLFSAAIDNNTVVMTAENKFDGMLEKPVPLKKLREVLQTAEK
jgi:CheY-like chemotaxis protein